MVLLPNGSFTLLLCTFWLCLVAPAVRGSSCELCFCTTFVVLCKSSAGLTSLPQDLPTEITYLDLSYNQIIFLDKSSLMRYPALQTLILKGNNLLLISSKTFEKNTKLVNLDIQTNRLFEIIPGTFQPLSNLQKLFLSNNQLDLLSEDVFNGLEKLNTLHLNGNKFTNIPHSTLRPLKSLQRLEMSGNEIHCDCAIAWMLDFKPLQDAINGPVVCSSPSALNGTLLSQVRVTALGCTPPTVEAVFSLVHGFKGQLGIELQCSVSGSPKPTKVEWFFRGERLSDSVFYRLPDNGSLMIVVMVPQLAGEYSCYAGNLMGNDTDQITLEYAGSQLPSFGTVPVNTHVFVGEDARVDCTVDQFTDEVQWEKDGVPIELSDRIYVLPGEGLLIADTTEEDSGVYACVAVNEEGSMRATAFVNVTGPLLSCNGILSREDVERLRLSINIAVDATHLRLQQATHSPSALLRRLRFPQGGLIEVLKAAEVFDQAVGIIRSRLLANRTVTKGSSIPRLSRCDVELLSELSGCKEHNRITDCSSCFHRKYRTIDGSCNNLDHPLWGVSETPFLRLMPAEYEDGIGLPVGWSQPKPSARLVSQRIVATKQVTPSTQFTLMLMQVGQFLDHDIDIAPVSPSGIVFNSAEPDSLTSCDDICHNDAPCFPIQVPENDPRIQRECLSFTRSSAVCGTGAASLLVGDVGIHREQLNAITSYVDGSQIYGSTNVTAKILRRNDGTGRLWAGNTVEGFEDKYFLPFDNNSLVDCNTGVNSDRSGCFLAGDVRVNEQVGLTTMHTLFFREHNRVVKILSALNPHWDGERLYQEARRIVISEWQNIVFSEYVPKIIGSKYIEKYSGYDSSIDASIANAFATAAFRFGHSQIMPLFPRLNSNYDPSSIGPLRLQDAFFAPFRLLEEGGIDPLLRGLVSSPVKLRTSDQGLNNNLTEALFAQAHEISLDLGALNIQRGRDHGLPSYNQWRVHCGLTAASTVSDLRNEITNVAVRERLEEVYGGDPNNIDLWVGGLVEDVLPGTQLGSTFNCIIKDQFTRLKDGDRFYFEREGQFSPDQLVQLKQASLARVICDNADNISVVPLDVFVLQSVSEFVSCDEVPTVDLQLWQECPDCDSGQCASDSRRKRSTLFKSLELQDNYSDLKMRVTAMEQKLGFCIQEGSYHENGQTWITSDCQACSCQGGVVECQAVECLSCDSTAEERCCPVCVE